MSAAVASAAQSASSAAQSATDASGYASAASSSATAAAGSATTAQGHASAAQTARAGAESAQSAAETAQGLAEDAQEAAETARNAAQSAQSAAESAKSGAEAAKSGAETAKTAAETAAGNASDDADAAASSASAAAQSAQAAQEAAQTALGIIDDEAVAADSTWSSKQIIDAICPPLEETGNPVQCYPVAGYPLGVKASWSPRQEGSGDPSPENVRPITGLDEVTVTLSDGVSDATTATLDLPSTVYGGEVDMATGEGSETWVCLQFDGTEGWYLQANGPYFVLNGNLPLLSVNMQIGSHFKAQLNFNEAESLFNTMGGTVYASAILASEFDSDLEAWKSYLAAQYAAGTPVTIAYKIATPQPIQAAGSQSLPALSGENVLITNADSLTVTGRADPNHTIQILSDRIAALESETIEGGINA